MGAAASTTAPAQAPTGTQIKHARNKLLLRNYLAHRGCITVRERMHEQLRAAGISADGFVPLFAARAALRTVGCDLNYGELKHVLRALHVTVRELHESISRSGGSAACGEEREHEYSAEKEGGSECALACDAVQLAQAFDVSSHPPPDMCVREWIDAMLQGRSRRSQGLEPQNEATGWERPNDQWTAAKLGDIGVLEQLTSAEQLLAPDAQGNTVMYHACHCGHARAVALIRARLVQCVYSTTCMHDGDAKADGESMSGDCIGTIRTGKASLFVLERRLGMRDGDLQRCFTNALNERTKRALIGEYDGLSNQEQGSESDGDDPGIMNFFDEENNEDY